MRENEPPSGPPRPRFLRPSAPPLLVSLLAVLFLVAHFNLKPVLGDEGVLAMDGWRIARGEVPHRDFFQFIPPLAGFIQAGAIRLLGPTVLAVRLLGLLCGILLIAAAASAGCAILRTPLARATALSVIVPFGVGVWPFASHHWWVDIFLLLGLVALMRAAESPDPLRPACVAGLLLGCAVLTMQDQGGYALAGTLAGALPLFPRGARTRALGGLVVGFFSCAGPSLAFLLGKVGPARLWEEWVLFPLSGYHGTEGNRVGFAEGFSQILGHWDPVALRVAPVYTTLVALDSMVVYALPLLAGLGLFFAWKKGWSSRAHLALLTVFGAAFLGAAFHRWSLMNLIWAAPLLAAVAALPLDRGLLSASPTRRRLSAAACAALLLTFCGFGILRIWAARSPRTHAVVTAAGSYRVFNPHEARDLQDFCDAVLLRVPPGEAAFCIGFNPLLSFLTGHPNPTRFNFLIPPRYNSPTQVRDWAHAIEEGHVAWGFGPNAPPDLSDPADVFVRTRFRPAWFNRSFVLWRRIDPEP